MTTDLDSVPTCHPAQKQALADLLNRLILDTRVEGVTSEEIAAAQEAVARHMDW